MKCFVLTKKNLLVIGLCVLLAVTTASIGITSATRAVSAATTQRKIPIYCVETDKKECAISFDAAWGNEQTDTLLDILDENDVKTTFFLVGDWAEKYPESVKKIAKKGHDVGNHSSTHPYMTQLPVSKMKTELRECNKKIKELTGKCPTLFRPPYGDYNNDVVDAVNGENMYCVQWSIDSLDWKDPTPEQIVQNCVRNLDNGSIIPLHNGAKNTPEALPMVIEAIKSKGFKLVPISKLLPKGKYTTDVQGKLHLCDNS